MKKRVNGVNYRTAFSVMNSIVLFHPVCVVSLVIWLALGDRTSWSLKHQMSGMNYRMVFFNASSIIMFGRICITSLIRWRAVHYRMIWLLNEWMAGPADYWVYAIPTTKPFWLSNRDACLVNNCNWDRLTMGMTIACSLCEKMGCMKCVDSGPARRRSCIMARLVYPLPLCYRILLLQTQLCRLDTAFGVSSLLRPIRRRQNWTADYVYRNLHQL